MSKVDLTNFSEYELQQMRTTVLNSVRTIDKIHEQHAQRGIFYKVIEGRVYVVKGKVMKKRDGVYLDYRCHRCGSGLVRKVAGTESPPPFCKNCKKG